MVIKIKGCRPVFINGKWELKDYEREEEFPDAAVRHTDLCTMCGFPSYPDCREWCPNEKILIEKGRG